MKNKTFRIICYILFSLILILLLWYVIKLRGEVNKINEYKTYNEAELDSAVAYLGLGVCQIIDGSPYFRYGSKQYNVIEFYRNKKNKSNESTNSIVKK